MNYKKRKKRGSLEIYVDCLKTIEEGRVKPTNMMNGANLSWTLAVKNIDKMVENGHCVFVPNPDRDERTPEILQLTDAGWRYIRNYNSMVKLID